MEGYQMRRWLLTLVSSVFVAFFAMVPQQADAFCIELSSFCDDIDLDFSGGYFYGYWDQNCDGSFFQPVFGARTTFGHGVEAPLGLATEFVLNVPARLFDLGGWDGFNPPFLFVNDSGFSILPTCDGPAAPIGARSTD
jgi:hypothetical protein